MNWNWTKYHKEKTLFRSYYCSECKQTKPCGMLGSGEKCCGCYYEGEKEQAQEYSNHQQVYQQKVKDQRTHFQQLLLLKNYSGCSKCGSKEIDAYELYENNKLICQPCLMEQKGGASGPISFLGKSKWYKKRWGIDLTQWLTQFRCLPINADCAREWLKNRNHLNNCQCLEREAKELVELFTSSLQKCQEELKNCACETSQKVRVEDDCATSCEKCEKTISVASKKRVIKNRNDPRFWGLEVSEKVLCGGCLEQKKEAMKPLRRTKFKEYRKLGMV